MIQDLINKEGVIQLIYIEKDRSNVIKIDYDYIKDETSVYALINGVYSVRVLKNTTKR